MIRTKEHAQKALKRTDDALAFYFHDESGFLNIKASSLEEAIEVIKNIDETSLIYHLRNNHFQRWVSDVFGDTTLSRRIDKISKIETEVREELLNLLEERLNWLKVKAGV